VIISIVGMIAFTVVAAYWLACSGGEKHVVFSLAADAPSAFGCSMAWLAVRCDEPESLIDALGLEDDSPCQRTSGAVASTLLLHRGPV